MKKWITLLFWLITLPAAHAKPTVLSPEQQAWVKHHPDVTYTVSDRWPQDYRVNGHPVGLSQSVLQEISGRTGLHFRYIPPEDAVASPPMLVAALSAQLLSDTDQSRWLMTHAWANTMPMLVGKNTTAGIRTLGQMSGKTLAIEKNSEYASWIRQHNPAVKLVEVSDVKAALQKVEDGDSDAAIGSGLVILPLLQRYYARDMAISGQVPEMASGIHMAVDPHYPVLRDIINVTLESVSAREAQQVFERWVGIVDFGSPSISVVIYHYRYELLVFGTLFILLMVTVFYALKARQRAQRSEKQKEEFLAIMSHEIRTPMNAIVAALELQQQPASQHKSDEYQALALSAANDLLELLNNVLDHSKLTHQPVPLQMAPCDIRMLLMVVCDSQRPSAERKGLTLDSELGTLPADLWINADAHRVRQIVNNLLSNAVKFTDAGRIALACTWKQEESVSGVLSVSVTDSGIGIGKADQQRLFQAWQQAESSGTRLRSGSGLGLYLSRQLAKQMGGDITLESEQGKGSIFTCTLPAQRVTDPESDTPTADNLPPLTSGLSVLIVEDHPANQRVISAQLDLLGCDWEVAESAEDAIQLLKDENYYDLMLLDCNLPGKDGYWLAGEIRQFERLHQQERTPLIAISAVSSQEHHKRCQLSGMEDVLVKPIRLIQLAEMLIRYCLPSHHGFNAEQLTDNATYTGRSLPVVNNEVQRFLREDLHHFHQACTNHDTIQMRYYSHRIRGVAQMYNLSELASLAEEIEQSLRQHEAPEQIRMDAWRVRLDHAISK